MGRTTRDYIEEMGQTGTGISSADQIDTSLDNTFTSKWCTSLPSSIFKVLTHS